MQTPQWDAFYAKLMEIYWPSVPPAFRVDGRPDSFKAPDDPEVPVDIYRALVMIFPDPSGPENWLHNPVPNLKSRTPLQVMKTGKLNAIKRILMEIAWLYLPDPSDVRPWTDAESESDS